LLLLVAFIIEKSGDAEAPPDRRDETTGDGRSH
jgi:hypothetical protein